MRAFITGATGFVGRKVVLALAREGVSIRAWVRDEARARGLLGADVELVPQPTDAELRDIMESTDVVINLAGAPIVQRWTSAAKRRLSESRVGVTTRLVTAMRDATRRPSRLVSASAVGIYGNRDDTRLTEHSALASEGFAAELSRAWEDAAMRAQDLGVEVALARLGVILGRDGGMLDKVLPVFGLGLGGTLAGGTQYQPYVHIHDAVELIVSAALHSSLKGPFNVSLPHPPTNEEFTKALGAALGRPTFAAVPEFALRLGLGEAADIVAASQRVEPRAILDAGHRLRFGTLDAALDDLITRPTASIGPALDVPDVPYLKERPPKYLLQSEFIVAKPRAEVFEFFQNAQNLAAMTPPDMSFGILTPTPIPMRKGQQIEYRIKLGPVPMKWRTSIERWDPPYAFVDAQLRGPYRSWYHEHTYEDLGGRTLVRDRVWYSPPFGPFGRIANRLFIARMLRRIFAVRADAMRFRFGEDPRESESRLAS